MRMSSGSVEKGVGVRFPGAADLDGFWRLLVEGRSAVGEVPGDRFPIAEYYREGAQEPGRRASP
jgi:acyl transferase domain-containing protein